MGKDRLKDKTIHPFSTITNLTPLTASVAKLGFLPIGNYKGAAAFFDLDKLANQPLVQAERLYALDRIDARDVVTATLLANSLVGTVVRARSVAVPAGEVWFINRITLVSPAQIAAEAIAQVNFRISTWAIPDARAGITPDADGRSYLPVDLGTAALDGFIEDLPAQGELGEELRLTAGAVITLVATATGAAVGVAAAGIVCTLTMEGRKGKLLVA